MTQLYVYTPFHVLFHYGLSQDIEYSSLCYTVSEVKVAHLCPTLCNPMDHTVPGILQDTILGIVGSLSRLQDLSNPGIEPRSTALRADSLPVEPLGKPKNTGVGNLSLFKQSFPTQELNRGLLHCRQIVY